MMDEKPRNADLRVGCIANFQVCLTHENRRALVSDRQADLEIGDTAG